MQKLILCYLLLCRRYIWPTLAPYFGWKILAYNRRSNSIAGGVALIRMTAWKWIDAELRYKNLLDQNKVYVK